MSCMLVKKAVETVEKMATKPIRTINEANTTEKPILSPQNVGAEKR